MSANATEYGKIIHSNDEIEVLLGYKRKDLIGRNTKCIIPRLIADKHDGFIAKYLYTGKF